MSLIDITPIRAFEDNYIWCLRQHTNCAVVDPGDAEPVLAYLKQNSLTLTDIIITHHHNDHVGGLAKLRKAFADAHVIGPHNTSIPDIDQRVSDGQQVRLNGMPLSLTVMAVPGHTLDHLAYYSEVGLFCGDTLFCAGCGRMFEGQPDQFYHSLQKLAGLPANTKVYCAHEYTLANLAFALAVEPENPALTAFYLQAKQLRQQQQPTLPSTIARENAINPFLRCHTDGVKQAVATHCNHELNSHVDCFAALRNWKDGFSG